MESHVSVIVSAGSETGDVSTDGLDLRYFTYSSPERNHISGVKAYLTGKDTNGVCEFNNVTDSYMGAFDTEFKANYFGGSCAYLLLLGVHELEPGVGHYVVKQLYDHTHIGHNTGKHQGKDLSGADFNKVFEDEARTLLLSVFALGSLIFYNM